MSLLNTTIPEDGDLPHHTQKKILQRLNEGIATSNFSATQPVSGTVSVDNLPAEQVVIGNVLRDDTIDGTNPTVVTRPATTFEFDASRGVYPDVAGVHKFGFNAAVPNGSFADVYSYGATVPVYPWPTAALKIRIKAGGNAADTAAGAGAQEITVVGLDTNFAEISETIATNGALVSAETTQSFRRVFRCYVSKVGTYGVANTGLVLVENSGGAVLASITAGYGQTQMTHYTVPAGKTAYLVHVDCQVASGTSKDADVLFWQRRDADDATAPTYGAKRLILQFIGLQGQGQYDFMYYPSFPAKTDLWASAKGNGALTGANLTYDLFLI